MDEADRAQIQIEADLERAIQAALPSTQPRLRCLDCDEPLPEHRKPWGLCIECKTIREARDKHHATGV